MRLIFLKVSWWFSVGCLVSWFPWFSGLVAGLFWSFSVVCVNCGDCVDWPGGVAWFVGEGVLRVFGGGWLVFLFVGVFLVPLRCAGVVFSAVRRGVLFLRVFFLVGLVFVGSVVALLLGWLRGVWVCGGVMSRGGR